MPRAFLARLGPANPPNTDNLWHHAPMGKLNGRFGEAA
jgi:hypothetical protein